MNTSAASSSVISSGEVYTLREAARRLRWGRKTMTKAQRDGLRCVQYGREKYIRGEAILEFFERMEGNGRECGS